MKAADYQKGVAVTKHSNFPGKKRIGVTVSDTAFQISRARGYFCLVHWEDSTRPEEVSLPILKEVEPAMSA